MVNHGISDKMIHECFEWVRIHSIDASLFRHEIFFLTVSQSKRFFSLPITARIAAAHPARPNPHRGYSYVGQERISGISGFEKGIFDAPPLLDTKVSD